MPMQWSEPELYLEHHNGVKVWHTYKNSGGNSSRMAYWYTTCEAEDDVESRSEYVFDVRDLLVPSEVIAGLVSEAPRNEDGGALVPEDVLHATKITYAIDKGMLKLPPENQPAPKDYEFCAACTATKKLQGEGVTSEDLHELVIRCCTKKAALVNSQGLLHDQVKFLLESGYTVDDIRKAIKA